MRIQHNVTALNVHRNLTGNNESVTKNLEKLSSGYKINRAGDDAAGLSISEKMRAQITGLQQAAQNADDGISLVQTVEGATTEVHSILNRMMELSVQSANGTYTSAERFMMDQEMQQLKTEISRIGDATTFNSIHLFPNSSSMGAKEALMTSYSLTVDLKNKTCQVDSTDRSGAVSPGGASSAARASQQLADKIAKEYFPNAISQILTAFPALQAEIGTDTIGMELHISHIDGKGGMLAYAQFSFYATGKPGNMLIKLDSSDFSDASLTGGDAVMLESTIAHELMHSVMQYTMTDEMSGRNGSEKFPEWFTEGTAQLSGGGFPTNWNDELVRIGKSLTSASDTSQDAAIANYLRKYSVAGRPYGHGYLASAYIGHLANGGGSSVSGSGIAAGMNKIFDEIINNNVGLYSAISNHTGGKIHNSSSLEQLFRQADANLVDFVRRLIYESKSGSGSVITGSLGDASMIGNGAAGNQPFYVTDVATRPTGTGIASTAGIELMVGDRNKEENIIRVELYQMNPDALGLTDTDVLEQDTAHSAIDEINSAIDQISSVRSYYGAVQNRLEHTVSSLGCTVENLTASESRIRDMDMAKAMMEYVRNSILVQSSQAMLAQANQQPSSVLQLLGA